MEDPTMELLHSQRPHAAVVDDHAYVIYLRHLLKLEEVGQVQHLAGRRPGSLQTLCIEVMCRHLAAGSYRWNLEILPPALACAVGDGCFVRLEPMKERLESAVVGQMNALGLGAQRTVEDSSSVLSSTLRSEQLPHEITGLPIIPTVSHSCPQSSHDSDPNSQLTCRPTPSDRCLKDHCHLSFDRILNCVNNNSTYYSQLLCSLYTKHTQLVWLRSGFSLDFYVSQAIALSLRSPKVKEIHTSTSIGQLETEVFLNEYIHNYRPDLLALCGNFKYNNLRKLLSRCSQLRRLDIVINDPCISSWDFHSAALTHLNLHINMSLSFVDLSNKLPNLEKLLLSSPIKVNDALMPRLYSVFPGTAASKIYVLPHLTTLEITSFFIYDALSTPLINLNCLTMRRCAVRFDDLMIHPALTALNLKLVKNRSGFDGNEFRFESVEALELHSQWGEKYHINLNSINISFPKLKSLALRNDFYIIDPYDPSQNTETDESGVWFQNLRQLNLTTTSGRPSNGSLAIFSAVLPALTTLFMKRCLTDTDLLARFCPRLDNVDFFYALPPVVEEPLLGVRRAIFRYVHLEVIEAICELLPALEMVEIRVFRVNNRFAQACKVLMHRLNKTRDLQMVVMEMW